MVRSLSVLCKHIFMCFSQEENPKNRFILEYKILKIKSQLFYQIAKGEQLLEHFSSEIRNENQAVLDLILFFSESILSISRLRYSTQDQDSFYICAQELNHIGHTLQDLCGQLLMFVRGKIYYFNFSLLRACLDTFETTYQSTLLIAVKNPLDFFLFIESLRSLEQIDRIVSGDCA